MSRTAVRFRPGPPLGDCMNLLCGHHAKDPHVCRWVIENCDENTDNITVREWVKACKEYLKSYNDGPDLVSTGQLVGKQTTRQCESR